MLSAKTPASPAERVAYKYDTKTLLWLAHSPLVCMPEGMVPLEVWYGSWKPYTPRPFSSSLQQAGQRDGRKDGRDGLHEGMNATSSRREPQLRGRRGQFDDAGSERRNVGFKPADFVPATSTNSRTRTGGSKSDAGSRKVEDDGRTWRRTNEAATLAVPLHSSSASTSDAASAGSVTSALAPMDAHGPKSMPEWMQDEVHVAKDAPARSQSSRSTPAPTGVESIEAFKAQMRENDRREAAERGESNARSELRGARSERSMYQDLAHEETESEHSSRFARFFDVKGETRSPQSGTSSPSVNKSLDLFGMFQSLKSRDTDKSLDATTSTGTKDAGTPSMTATNTASPLSQSAPEASAPLSTSPAVTHAQPPASSTASSVSSAAAAPSLAAGAASFPRTYSRPASESPSPLQTPASTVPSQSTLPTHPTLLQPTMDRFASSASAPSFPGSSSAHAYTNANMSSAAPKPSAADMASMQVLMAKLMKSRAQAGSSSTSAKDASSPLASSSLSPAAVSTPDGHTSSPSLPAQPPPGIGGVPPGLGGLPRRTGAAMPPPPGIARPPLGMGASHASYVSPGHPVRPPTSSNAASPHAVTSSSPSSSSHAASGTAAAPMTSMAFLQSLLQPSTRSMLQVPPNAPPAAFPPPHPGMYAKNPPWAGLSHAAPPPPPPGLGSVSPHDLSRPTQPPCPPPPPPPAMSQPPGIAGSAGVRPASPAPWLEEASRTQRPQDP